MSIDLEVSIKIRLIEGVATVDQPAASRRALCVLARLVSRITSHPCIVMILREFTKKR